MKNKVFFQTLLGIGVAIVVAFSLLSFTQSDTYRNKVSVVKLTIKNESTKTVKSVTLTDSDENLSSILNKELKPGESVKVEVTCGNYVVQHEDTEGNSCDWGAMNTCKETTITIKAKCPGDDSDDD